MLEVNTSKMCRLCVIEHDGLVDITKVEVNTEETSSLLVDFLNNFTGEEITSNLDYSNGICKNCVNQASNAYKFKIQCQNSLQKFHHYVQVQLSVINNRLNTADEKKVKGEVPIFQELQDTYFNDDDIHIDNSKSDYPNQGKRQLRGRKPKIKQNTNANIGKTSRKDEKNSEDVEVETKSENLDIEKNISDEDYVEEEDLGTVFFCSYCNKSFSKKVVLQIHEKRHILKGSFLCNICGKGFNSQSCLTRHNRVHTGEKNYSCEVCQRKFPSSNNLKLHMRTHNGLKPYLCTVCGKCFSHPTGLTYHMRTHTKEKPYACDVCGRKFAIHCHVTRHRRTHTGERPFACTQCDKAFVKKIDLKRHEAIHLGIRPHVCSVCKKSFLRKTHLNYHMMLHTEERPHVCKICGKGFIRVYYLNDHIKRHHKPSTIKYAGKNEIKNEVIDTNAVSDNCSSNQEITFSDY